MPLVTLKALECNRPHAGSLDTNVRVVIEIDDKEEKRDIELGTLSFRDRRILNRSFLFSRNVKLSLRFKFGITEQIGHSLTLTTLELPHLAFAKTGFHRGKLEFNEANAHYYLWYEVIPDGMSAAEFHRVPLVSPISVRETLGRNGQGAMTREEHLQARRVPFEEGLTRATYLCSEVISVRDTFALHRPQDGQKGNTVSLREWVDQHCNIWGEETVIPIEQLPGAVSPITHLPFVPNWRPVTDESSRVLAGFCDESRQSHEDNPLTHMSKDWVFNILPSPAFSYLLAYTAKTKSVIDSENINAERSILPKSHNEWESGSMPTEWRPVPGEYVTIFGRHVFDLAHLTMTTEIHPPHTIVREATIGNFNQAIIGMGFSGGFPGSIQAQTSGELNARWNAEFGGFLEGLDVKHRRCWATNLKKHPLKIKLFPPVPRPSPTAKLIAKTREWRIITVRTSRIDEFLKSCGSGGPKAPVEHSFNGWFPDTLQINPPAFKPILIERGGFFDLEINLSGAQDIPVAYYARVDCFWE